MSVLLLETILGCVERKGIVIMHSAASSEPVPTVPGASMQKLKAGQVLTLENMVSRVGER